MAIVRRDDADDANATRSARAEVVAVSARPNFATPTVRLGTARRRLLYGLVTALTLTGAVWMIVHFTQPEDAMPNAVEPWMMRIHGGAAMLFLFFAGTMLYGHMLGAWQRRRNRLSGGIASAVFVVLVLTGYGLYYFGGDQLRNVTEWLHWSIGLGAPLVVWWHIRRGRRLAVQLRD